MTPKRWADIRRLVVGLAYTVILAIGDMASRADNDRQATDQRVQKLLKAFLQEMRVSRRSIEGPRHLEVLWREIVRKRILEFVEAGTGSSALKAQEFDNVKELLASILSLPEGVEVLANLSEVREESTSAPIETKEPWRATAIH